MRRLQTSGFAKSLRLFWPPNGLRGQIWPHQCLCHGQNTLPNTFWGAYFGLICLSKLVWEKKIKNKKEPTVPRPASWKPQVKSCISPCPAKLQLGGRHKWTAVPIGLISSPPSHQQKGERIMMENGQAGRQLSSPTERNKLKRHLCDAITVIAVTNLWWWWCLFATTNIIIIEETHQILYHAQILITKMINFDFISWMF